MLVDDPCGGAIFPPFDADGEQAVPLLEDVGVEFDHSGMSSKGGTLGCHRVDYIS